MKKSPKLIVLVRRLSAKPGHPRGQHIIGHCERAAIAVALRLRTQLGGSITALSVGSAKSAHKVLDLALRAGCDRAVQVDDRKFEDLDSISTARVIAKACAANGFDYILCGDRSQDEAEGGVGPATAEFLEIPHLAGIVKLTTVNKKVVATTQGDGKLYHIKVTRPLVLAVRATADLSALELIDDIGAREITEIDGKTFGLDINALLKRVGPHAVTRPVRFGNNAAIAATGAALIQRLGEDHLLE